MNRPVFVPLHVHTAYSLAEGAVRASDLAARLAERGIPAAAMTDTNTLSGNAEFCDKLTQKGIQPIVGAQISVEMNKGDDTETINLLFYCKDENGYRNLVNLLSTGALRQENSTDLPSITLDHVAEFNEGLLCAGAGKNGPFDTAARRGDISLATARMNKLKAIFGNRFYAGIARTGETEDETVAHVIAQICEETEVPVLALNEIHYLDADTHEAHDALVCIATGSHLVAADRPHSSPHNWLRSDEEMLRLFADMPEALENTIEFARRCAHKFAGVEPMLPAFPTADGRSEEEELDAMARQGLEERLKGPRFAAHEVYFERLEYELRVIKEMGFPGYFLIVADFIQWAKAQGIAVGPGRGSGAGSVVAWALTITNLDPIRYGLLFERFLNPDRVSMPDFDIDFEQARREEVIDYVRRRYGTERVAQIGTFGKLQARAAVRDVARVMQIPYPVVDRLASMIPNNPANPVSLKDAMEMEPLASTLASSDGSIRHLFDIALKLEGLYRHASTHAAGVVIADRPVPETVPVFRDPHGAIVTQYDMKAVEKAGLVKFDFLGLKTLDTIQGALRLAAETKDPVSLESVGVEDADTYEMLAKGDAYGVFQLESAGMRQAMKQIAPTGIDDIIALVSLYRPGPMENIPTYAAVKNGSSEASYLHPEMEPILKDTNGIIIYQEQVMELARRLAGYSLGQADLLRRAMGKKIKAEMDAQREVFQNGAAERGIDPKVASDIFDLIARFANYGFNKSHAAAYAMLAFQTAYLKKHVPHAFYASTMNLDISDTEKLATSYHEIKREGLLVLPPCVNASRATFFVQTRGSERAIRWALAALRGVGIAVMNELVDERRKNGRYVDFPDFILRTASFLNKRTIEKLIRAGALDTLSSNRGAMLAELDKELKAAQSENRAQAAGQSSFFDIMAVPEQEDRDSDNIADLSKLERLAGEFDTLGIYLSGHPLENAANRLATRQAWTLAEICDPDRRFGQGDHLFGALLMKITARKTKNGDPMGVLLFSDPTGAVETVAFGDEYLNMREKLKEGQAYVVKTGVGDRDGERRLFIRDVEPLPLDEGFDGTAAREAAHEAA